MRALGEHAVRYTATAGPGCENSASTFCCAAAVRMNRLTSTSMRSSAAA